MSKKRKTQQKQENLLQSVAALTANGLKAFRQKEFEKAISTWGKIPVKLRLLIFLPLWLSRLFWSRLAMFLL